jgi:hypothetical protein
VPAVPFNVRNAALRVGGVLCWGIGTDDRCGSFSRFYAINELTDGARRLLERHASLVAEFGDSLSSDDTLAENLERNPIAAWTGGHGTGGNQYFKYEQLSLIYLSAAE